MPLVHGHLERRRVQVRNVFFDVPVAWPLAFRPEACPVNADPAGQIPDRVFVHVIRQILLDVSQHAFAHTQSVLPGLRLGFSEEKLAHPEVCHRHRRNAGNVVWVAVRALVGDQALKLPVLLPDPCPLNLVSDGLQERRTGPSAVLRADPVHLRALLLGIKGPAHDLNDSVGYAGHGPV